jgi:RHS repeat-associated protein
VQWIAQYEYGPFGEVIRATGPMARVNPFRWSTQYTDDETDLVMYPARPYNPSTGRFLCKDPVEEQDGLNLYGFMGNNPNGWACPGLMDTWRRRCAWVVFS